jgi:two-component system response regulator FixJ
MSRSENVYVIDDDPAMRDSLDFLLSSAGFSVTLFGSAVGFLAALPGLGFGCVVSDVRMPDLDGIELLHRLKADGRKLPIVIMTGHGDIPLAVEAMKLGALDFLEKPFEDDRLIGMIIVALKQHVNEAQSQAVAVELAARIGLSNKLIARDYGISPRTIEVYRANVMTKMQAGSVSELVRLAMRGGLLKD